MRYISIALLAVVIPYAASAEPALAPMLGKPGKLLFSDTFDSGAVPEEWKGLHGTHWDIVDGTLHGTAASKEHQAEAKAKNRHTGGTPSSRLLVATHDCIMQFDFKFNAKMKGAHFGFNDGFTKSGTGHVCRFTVSTKSGMKLDKDKNSKIAGDKEEVLATSDLNLEKETWYTAQIEINGTNMVARIVNGPTLQASHPRFDFPKDQINLPTRGGGEIYYDNIYIWEFLD